ncbi:MAG: hypothetical protein ACK553_19095 [Planctomycetota bacterium]|jgi:hypothetical protein
MNGFVFTQRFNTPDTPSLRAHNRVVCVADGRAPTGVTPTHFCDATGSFHGGAATLRRQCKVVQPTFIYDNTLPAARRRQAIFAALSGYAPSSVRIVAYFGHGTPHGLESAGIGSAQLQEFSRLLLDKCEANASIVFYACSTGAAGGFAEQLANLIISKNVSVYGHTSYGKYANLSMFRRYPGGYPLTHSGHYTFWMDE